MRDENTVLLLPIPHSISNQLLRGTAESQRTSGGSLCLSFFFGHCVIGQSFIALYYRLYALPDL